MIRTDGARTFAMPARLPAPRAKRTRAYDVIGCVCVQCGAPPLFPCLTRSGNATPFHDARERAWKDEDAKVGG